MASDDVGDLSIGGVGSPSLEISVLSTLSDRQSREILKMLADADAPLRVADVTDRGEIAESTAYRKLGRLAEIGIVEQASQLTEGGRTVKRYALTDTRISIQITNAGIETSVENGERR